MSQLIDENGEFQPQVKEKIVKDLCETTKGKCWFLGLAMPILIAPITELIENTHEANPDVVFPKVVKAYSKKVSYAQSFLGTSVKD